MTSHPPSTGPSVSSLDVQVQQAVTGTGGTGPGVTGVVRTVCHSPASWSAGQKFKCEVYGSAQKVLGEYEGTVQLTTSDE